MEGITWVKVAAIVALFLGSIYVLIPTFVEGDLEAVRAATAASVSTPASGRATANLEVLFDSPSPEGAVPVLQARLAAAGVAVDRVSVREGRVSVTLRPGTRREQVTELAGGGVARLYAPDALAPVPATVAPLADDPQLELAVWEAVRAAVPAQAAHWGRELPNLTLAPVPAEAQALPVQIQGLEGRLLATDGALPEGLPFAVVAVDDRVVGLALPGEPGLAFAPLRKRVITSTGDSWVGDDRAVGLLAGPLPAPLVEVVEAVEVDEDVGPQGPPPEPALPAWFLALLPDTVIQRGLDLQGGLDITLQVEIEEAVLASVARDAQALEEAARKAGINLVSARRDKVEPILWFEGGDLSELQAVVRENNRDYLYSRTENGRHGFTLNATRVQDIQKMAVDQVLETLRKRVDGTGVKEPSIVKKGGGRINVQLPGAVDLQAAVDAIGTTAVLEFYMVDPRFDRSLLDGLVDAAERALPPDQFADDLLVNEWLWQTKRLPDDRKILWHYEETPEGMTRQTYGGGVPLVNDVVLTGNDVAEASVGFDQNNMPSVALGFKPRGGQIFCDITTKHVGEQFAIVLDGQVRSAPSIRERICGGRASIDMGSSMNALQDANTLALVLRTGSLDAPVSIGEVRQVGAQLGQDAIRDGLIASTVSACIVFLFMGLWYRMAGMIANVALFLNMLMVAATLAIFGATLTLPGIAGIALTVAMAVDANIIVFERIREEIRTGIAPRKAVDIGFDKALSAVLDGNITSMFAGIVLYSYGTGPVKGFAVTLMVGLVTTLITAIFVTRTLLELVTRRSNARITI